MERSVVIRQEIGQDGIVLGSLMSESMPIEKTWDVVPHVVWTEATALSG